MQPTPPWRIADNFWDLRDDAVDHPDRWDGVKAVDLFQRLAECVEEAEERGGPMDWLAVRTKMIDWRAG